MTVCTKQLTFSFYHDKQLVADFKGGQISSDAGLLLLREIENERGDGGQASAASRVVTSPSACPRNLRNLRMSRRWCECDYTHRRLALFCGYDRAWHSMREGERADRLLFAPAALRYSRIICVICRRLCCDLKFRLTEGQRPAILYLCIGYEKKECACTTRAF
jgi:hypothetical protein